ncbi:hypothetical protein PC119_g5510 [Phytophthora cactorum]|uniref:Uncharacterized protein n=1 Tax=Phytophthora cactorum TaxID=29920 RepID=A0A8T1EBZ9_9STRA|nr:hypothetical protein PC114_g6161 [Phytophthora cactorum]KAG2948793.1 hypothetical protein PC117_g5748 [Phytophthora cactorum]KAG3030639.1 hypothetical protein PC120_g3580 [Phytophthora cactorum]KAG3032931.1 hypothetical protein PC119_g5510 [Phytophthora cactorum]KAG3182252.1 hypothetical protein C6341_g6039 [Phytophthora cactorum]
MSYSAVGTCETSAWRGTSGSPGFGKPLEPAELLAIAVTAAIVLVSGDAAPTAACGA